jgi:flavodoxin
MSKKILVACFSASGTTKKVGEKLAKAVNGDFYEIVPKQPYTKADLNWMNKNSRSSVEMNDPSSRPEIADRVENIEQYDVVFVGFPVWWYREPSIIDTFMESTDLAGKAVVPFCTSGGSGLGRSARNMQSLAPEAKVLDGKRFPSSVSSEELKKWAEQF